MDIFGAGFMSIKQSLGALLVFFGAFLSVYFFGETNAWVAFFIAFAITLAHEANQRASNIQRIMSNGLVDNFDANDELNNRNIQRIDELANEVDDLELKIQELEDRLEGVFESNPS